MTSSSDSPATYSMTTHWSPIVVGADVVEGDQVRVLEVQALRDAAQLDVEVAADELERDFLAGVAGGEVDLAEAAAADAALDRVAVQRPRAAGIGEFHRRGTRPLGPLQVAALATFMAERFSRSSVAVGLPICLVVGFGAGCGLQGIQQIGSSFLCQSRILHRYNVSHVNEKLFSFDAHARLDFARPLWQPRRRLRGVRRRGRTLGRFVGRRPHRVANRDSARGNAASAPSRSYRPSAAPRRPRAASCGGFRTTSRAVALSACGLVKRIRTLSPS